MTATTPIDHGATTTSEPSRLTRPAPRRQQVIALARAEWAQLLANKVALLNCFALPLLMVFFFAGIGDPLGMSFGALVPMLVLGTALLFVVYYTLVTSFVARRESLLLKRLRSGECGDGVIVAGLAGPFVVVTLAQVALAVLASVTVLDVPIRAHLLLVVPASVLSVLAWVALAVASTGLTKNVEHAQITTMPAILVPLLLSGLSIPLAIMPEPLQAVAHLAPMTPGVELMHLALTGQTMLGDTPTGAGLLTEVANSSLVLLAWSALGWWLARRTLRWEPRS